MTDAQKALAIERELNGAKASFNIARMALESALNGYGRDGVQDRLIYFAEEYGVDHALATMTASPADLGLSRSVAKTDVHAIEKALKSAHAANHRLDTLMAEREGFLAKRDGSHAKGFMLGDKEVVFDPAAGTLLDRRTGKIMPATMERVEPEREHDNDRERDGP